MKAVKQNEKCSFTSRQISVAQLHRVGIESVEAFWWCAYWQAPQPESLMTQNLMSVPGDMPISAGAASAPDETAFILPASTVDFSVRLALMVHR